MTAATVAEVPARPLPRPLWRRRVVAFLPVALLILVAVIGPSLIPHDPERIAGPPDVVPGGEFYFGTDSSGFDVFSRVVAATRINLTIATAVMGLSTIGGIALGLVLGMNESRRGPFGLLSRGAARVVDLSEAIPAVLVALVIVSFYGASIPTIVASLTFVLMSNQARLVRTEVLQVRSDAYLDAARMAGLNEMQLTVRHVLPNASWPALENASVIFGIAVIITAGLGFLGVGLQPPTPEWGSMIARGSSSAAVGRWWSSLFPAIALTATVTSVAVAATALFARSKR